LAFIIFATESTILPVTTRTEKQYQALLTSFRTPADRFNYSSIIVTHYRNTAENTSAKVPKNSYKHLPRSSILKTHTVV
jgi:hypothetical protein